MEASERQQEVQQIVERAVSQVLASQLPQLQAELVQRVLEALPAPSGVPSNTAAAAENGAANLLQTVSGIHAGSTQKEILRGLVEGGSAYCARIALFVVKAGAATGWQGRGFADDEAVKDFSLDMNAGPIGHAYQHRVVTPANVAEMEARFVEQLGGPTNEQILVLPLVLKDKVAALVYADGGGTGVLDGPALELLVMATGAWLEVVSLRKQAQAKESGDLERSMAAAPVQTVSSFSDPFASHAPNFAPAAASMVSTDIPTDAPTYEPAQEPIQASVAVEGVAPPVPEPVPVPEPQAEVVEVAAVGNAAAAASASASAAAPAMAADPFATLSSEDADTHRKAQRFARLLVDEIKLYNQAKVAEGRKNKDLYDRMKDDIEKSRGTYQKRYGATAAANANYFQQELVRSLAEEDVSVMGANFRQ